MAIHLNISRRTLIRRFRDHLGTTPNTYVQQHKIELAKRLLETSALSFEAISEQVGYADTGSFRRLFKREMGLTPKQYRLQVAATVC
jgi:transcriptional regulator GlxA family with amidase domain